MSLLIKSRSPGSKLRFIQSSINCCTAMSESSFEKTNPGWQLRQLQQQVIDFNKTNRQQNLKPSKSYD